MADGYEYGRRGREEDFDEEEVWAVMKERKEGSPNAWKAAMDSISSTPRRLSSASRMIPKSTNGYAENGGGRGFQQSAPVNIPDWSKIYRKKGSSEIHAFSGWHHGTNGGGDDDDDNDHDHVVTSYFVEEEEDDDDEDRIPPHEWIAKKLARSQISSFSVFEGRGRTLKGRDLSKVRNAVLTRTGFIECSQNR